MVHKQTSSANINTWLVNYDKVIQNYTEKLEASKAESAKRKKSEESETEETEINNEKKKKKKEIVAVELF